MKTIKNKVKNDDNNLTILLIGIPKQERRETYKSPVNFTFYWNTTFKDSGIYKTSIIISDGVLSDVCNFTITVNNVNKRPIL